MIPTVACVAVVTCFCHQHHHITINHIMGWTGFERRKKTAGFVQGPRGLHLVGELGAF